MKATTLLIFAMCAAFAWPAAAGDLYYMVFQQSNTVNTTLLGLGLEAFCTKTFTPSLDVPINNPSGGNCQVTFSFKDPGRDEYQTCLTQFFRMNGPLLPLTTAFYNHGGLMLYSGNVARSSVTRTKSLPRGVEPTQQPPPSPSSTNVTYYAECPVTNPVSSICDYSECQLSASSANGTCESKFGESSMLSCANETTTCAELLTFSDMNCSNASTVVSHQSVVCGSCNLIQLDGALPYAYSITCDADLVTVAHACNASCGNCSFISSFVVGTCGTALSFLTSAPIMSVSQLRQCQAVRASLYSSEGCPAVNITQSTVKEQGFCDMTDPVALASTIICPNFVPQPPVTYPPQQPATLPPITPAPVVEHNVSITVTTCSDKHCLVDCKTELRNSTESTCIPMGQYFAKHRCTEDNATYSCLEAVIFADSQCTTIDGLYNMQCGSCTQTPTGDTIRVNCDVGNSSISIDSGCDDTCDSCANIGGLLPPNECGMMPGGGAFIVPAFAAYCRVVERLLYSDMNCSQLVGSGFIAQQVCDNSHEVVCDGFEKPPPNPVTINPLPDTPPANAVVAMEYACSDVHCTTCTNTDQVPDNTCYLPSSGDGASYELLECIAGVPRCITVTTFSDALCSNITTIDNHVCDVCNNNGTAGTSSYACAGAGVTKHYACDATCSSCKKIATASFNKCSFDALLGSYAIFSTAMDCFAYKVSSFNTSNCSSQPQTVLTLPQMLCNKQKYVACPYNGFTNAPTVSHGPFTAAPLSILPTSGTTMTPAFTNGPGDQTSQPPNTATTLGPQTAVPISSTTSGPSHAPFTTASPSQPSTAMPATPSTASPGTPTAAPPTSTGAVETTAVPAGSTTALAPSTVSPTSTSSSPSPVQTTPVSSTSSGQSPAPSTLAPPPTAPNGYIAFTVTFDSDISMSSFPSALRGYFSNAGTGISVLSSSPANLAESFFFTDANAKDEQDVFQARVIGNATALIALGLSAATSNAPPAVGSPPSSSGNKLVIIGAGAGGGALLLIIIAVVALRMRKAGQVGAREYISMQEYESGRLN